MVVREDDGVGHRIRIVGSGLAVHILDARQDHVPQLFRDGVESRAAFVILTVVACPGFSENLPAESHWVILFVVSEMIFLVLTFDSVECVCRGAKTKNRATALQVLIEILHGLIRGIQESHEQEHHVGTFQSLHAGDPR
jgi:hypothetical protein